MAIISFSKDATIDYVPEYGGNRESEEPCIVRLKYIPYSRVQEYSRMIAARVKGLNDVKRIDCVQDIQRKQFIDNVESVSGYYVDTKPVTDASEFYATAPAELIVELVQAMESAQRLSDGQRKNS